MNFYPLRLEPQVKEVVWGGRWLAGVLGRPGPEGAKLGESWEAYSNSLVTNGPLAGRRLGELFAEYGAALLGTAALDYPKFPLLVKFIDAKENLSVQVHPDDALAQRLENYPFGKTEFWYVVEAEPGAEICYGLNDRPAGREELRAALSNNTILDYLQRSPVKAGDFVYIPAGTVHALTKGIVVYELQQDSDITYRLYDWGRVGREIHIDKGLEVIRFDYRNMQVAHAEPRPVNGHQEARLIESPYFQASLLKVGQAARFQAPAASFVLLSILRGEGRLTSPGGSFETEALARGHTILVPAGLEYTLESSGAAELELISGWLVEKAA